MSEQEAKSAPVSLVNFQRNSPKVVFTERASLEAIKRCGFKMEDFSYRSLKDFKKPGVDADVAKMMYTKSEDRRQKMISEAIEMRDALLSERRDREPASATGDRSRNTREYRDLVEGQERELKRLVVTKLRDVVIQEGHINEMQKTNQRSLEIEKQRNDRDQAFRQRTFDVLHRPMPVMRRSAPLQRPPFTAMSQLSERRLAEMQRKEQLRKRKQEEIQNENMRQIIARSNQLKQQKVAMGERRLQMEASRFNSWKKRRDEEVGENSQTALARQMHSEEVLEKGKAIHMEKLKRVEDKIAGDDARLKEFHETDPPIKAKIEQRKMIYDERLGKANMKVAERKEMIEQTRRSLDAKDIERQKKIMQMQKEIALGLAERQFNRQEKVDEIERKRAAEEYVKELERMPEAMLAKAQIETEEERRAKKLAEKKLGAKVRYEEMRQAVIAELALWNGSLDRAHLNQLQNMLGVSREEVDDLVRQARKQLKASKATVTTTHPV